jgi:segregation and condensation protein A
VTQELTFDFQKVQPEIIGEKRGGEELKLRLGEFAGPLDLLLHLIKHERVNIYDIPIARIADEYVRYLRLMEKLDISVAGDFLVMAATLIEIKSRMLLPRDSSLDGGDEDELDPRRELVHRLLEHQKFKAAAEVLWEKATLEQSVFTRHSSDNRVVNGEVNVGTFDLLGAFQRILARSKQEIALEIEREEFSLVEIIAILKAQISTHKIVNLNVLLAELSTRREIIFAFLALLELVRTSEIKLVQIDNFGEIIIHTD